MSIAISNRLPVPLGLGAVIDDVMSGAIAIAAIIEGDRS